jgi:hypothetical protein
MRKIKHVVLSFVLAAMISLTVGSPSLAAPNPPGPDIYSFDVDAGVYCPFAFNLSVIGQTKTIDLTGNHTIVIFPGESVTLTNLENSNKVTRTIPGSYHTTTFPDGSFVTVFDGPNLTWDANTGLVFINGHFSYSADASGAILQHLNGHGKMIDACALIQ